MDGECHHLKTIDDHETELVLRGNAQRSGDITGLFVHNIGVRTQLELRRVKNNHLNRLEITERSFISKHFTVYHSDQSLAELILR